MAALLPLLLVFVLAAVAFAVSPSATQALTVSRRQHGKFYQQAGGLLGAARLWAIAAGAVLALYLVANCRQLITKRPPLSCSRRAAGG